MSHFGADPEGLRVLEVHVAGLALRLERREEHVERRDEDVQVLGVRQQHEEAEQGGRVEPPGEVEDHGNRARGQPGQEVRDRDARELPGVGRGGREPDAPGVGHQVRHHEAEDQEQDHQRFRREVQAPRPGHEPPEDRVADGQNHQHAEQVLDDQVGGGVGEAGQEERLGDALAEELDGAEGEDDEAPEDRGVHQPRPEVVGEQPRLAEDVDDHPADARGHLVPARQGLPLEEQPQEVDRAPREEHDRGRDQRVEDQPAGNDPVPLLRRQHQRRLIDRSSSRCTVGVCIVGVGLPKCQGRLSVWARIWATAE